MGPKWHVPSDEEIQYANELIELHFKSALDDLLRICQTKIHSDPGMVMFSSYLCIKKENKSTTLVSYGKACLR